MELTFSLHIIFLLSSFPYVKSTEINTHQKLHFLKSFLIDNPINIDIYISSWPVKHLLDLSKHGNIIFPKNSSRINTYAKLKIYDCINITNINILNDNIDILLLMSDNTSIQDFIQPKDTLPKRNIILAKFHTVGDGFVVKLMRCYRVVEHFSLIEEYLFTWSSTSKNPLNFRRFSKKRLNFQGLKLPVAIILNNPESTKRLEDFRDEWTDSYSKVNYGPIIKLMNYFNITPEFNVLKDYKHLTHENKFILTVTAPYLTKDLLAIANFVKVAPATNLCYLLRRPPTSFVTTIFTVTFSPGVWFASLALAVVLSSALYVLLNIEARRKDIKGQTDFSVYDMFLIGFEAICQQGTGVDPSGYSTRILSILMFMAFMFLYVAYSANILVLLQSTTALTKPNALLYYGIEYAGMDTQNYNYYPEAIGETVFKTNINATKRLSVNEGMSRARLGLFGFFMESNYGRLYARSFYTDYDVCGLQEYACRIDFSLGYTAIPKNSPYYEHFKIAMLQIYEAGFSNRHYLRYFQKPGCYSKGSSFDEIGIREIYQALLLVIMGVGCGLLILCIEIVLNRTHRRDKITFLN